MIAALAAAKGVTHAELADLIGIHRNRFSDKVKGKSSFREAEISAIADRLGVTPGRLFSDPVALLSGVSESAWTLIGAGQNDWVLAA